MNATTATHLDAADMLAVLKASCTARLADGPLVCVRTDPHEPHRGCTYQSTSGVPDCPKEEL